MENPILKIKGVSYFGVRSLKHVLTDMAEIKAAGFNKGFTFAGLFCTGRWVSAQCRLVDIF